MKPIVELKDVWKIYPMGKTEVQALRGMTFKVNKGEFVAIKGPSGSGKSTAMNLVGCLDTPTKGHIYLDGKDISLMQESELAQVRGQKIGFVFQKFNLITTLTAMENVMLPLVFQNIPIEEQRKKAKEILTFLGMEERMDHKPGELSGGQQQRVAIARALATEPEMILADEPTGNLDSTTGKMIMELLQELNKKHKKTIVLVTHDDQLAKMAQRIAYLKDGQIVAEAKT